MPFSFTKMKSLESYNGITNDIIHPIHGYLHSKISHKLTSSFPCQSLLTGALLHRASTVYHSPTMPSDISQTVSRYKCASDCLLLLHDVPTVCHYCTMYRLHIRRYRNLGIPLNCQSAYRNDSIQLSVDI